MNNETSRGRAQLRDNGPAQGLYEVDYVVHTTVRTIKNIGQPPLLRTTISADIRSVSGYTLKNGAYALEQDGKTLYQLEKTGTNWQVVSCVQALAA